MRRSATSRDCWTGSGRARPILREASGRLPVERTLRLLDRLVEAGLLAERPARQADDAAERAYWAAVGLGGGAAVRSAATVHTLAVGGVAPEAPARTPSRRHRSRSGPAAEAQRSWWPATTTSIPRLGELDRGYREAGRALAADPALHGTETWIGPFLGVAGRPRAGPVLAERLRRSRPVEHRLQQGAGLPGPLPRRPLRGAGEPARGAPSGGLEAVKWLAGHRYPGQQALWTLNGLCCPGSHHPVRRRPRSVHDCGDPGLVAAQVEAPVVLTSRPKGGASDGGEHRALPPEEMLRRYGHHVDPLTGRWSGEIRR